MEVGIMEMIRITDLCKTYGSGEASVKALDHVSLSVDRGEFLAVVGTSGSGKTTLLNMMGGLDVPDSGSLVLDQKDLAKLGDKELTILRRRKIGFIFQQFNLIPMLNVWENIILPLKLDNRAVDNAYLGELLSSLGLEGKQKRRPDQLSGGQQQRVAIARALAVRPSVILADEPTGNLDSRTSQDVMGLLKVLGSHYRQTIIMITHNEEIAQLADRIIHIEDGAIVHGQRHCPKGQTE